MVHDRVAGQSQFDNLGDFDLRLARDFNQQALQGFAHCAGEILFATRIHHHIGDAAHQVFTKADLWIHQTAGGDYIAIGKVAQMRGNGGRTNIYGHAIGFFFESGINRNNISAANSDRHLPLARTQHFLQASQHMHRCIQTGDLPLPLQCVAHPAKIGGRIMHIRFGNFHKIEPHNRVNGNGVGFGTLAHHLPVHLTVGRHINQDVATDFGLTAQPPPFRQWTTLRCIARLNGSPVRDMAVGGGNIELRIDTIDHADLAAATNATPTTYRVQIDAQFARSFEHRCAIRHMRAFARGREKDGMGFGQFNLANVGVLRSFQDLSHPSRVSG